jgi:hypothetical protein
MPTTLRLAGLAEGTINNEKGEVNFVLKISDGRGLAFVAEVTAARQISSALGKMALQAKQSMPLMVGAEKVVQYGVKNDAFGDVVLLQLVSEDGVPYMFALPRSAAGDIATRLSSESERHSETGRA